MAKSKYTRRSAFEWMPARLAASAERQRSRDERRHTPLPPERPDGDTRAEAKRDRDRVIYAISWMRLGGVTQVINHQPDSSVLVQNRMTHSLRVAQVARSIAEKLLSGDASADKERRSRLCDLGGLDADVAAAAGLAHDLGHAPYGHIGEEVMDEVARESLGLVDGFEGNAQTLRIVTKIERRASKYPGMDLTQATRAALLKYPWTRVPRRAHHEAAMRQDTDYRRKWTKFNAYDVDADEMVDARMFLPPDYPAEVQTLEASVMDAADDITYAVHDLEDFFVAGVLNWGTVAQMLEDGSPEIEELKEKLVKDYQGYFKEESFAEALTEVSWLLRRSLPDVFEGLAFQVGQVRWHFSQLIGRYVNATNLTSTADPFWPGGPFIALERSKWHEVQILKHITRVKIVNRSDIADLQHSQQKGLRETIMLLLDRKERDFTRLRKPLHEQIEMRRRGDPREPENRCILDYLCGYTDDQCSNLNLRLTGKAIPTIGTSI